MQGLSLPDLAAEVERQNRTKRDFIAPASRIKYVEDTEGEAGITRLSMQGQDKPFDIGTVFHQQVGEHLKIPRAYYSRMLESAPVLLRRNVNHWLAKDPSPRMIRTLDGRARAFLSDRYRVLDNFDLCEAVLPLFAEHKLEVVSAQVTERRMYIKATHPRLNAKIVHAKIGDVVQGGVSVWNSETGNGTMGAEAFVYRLSCSNGLTVPMSGLKRFHLGRRYAGDEAQAQEIFRDETRLADDKAFFMKMQDVVNACLKEEMFQKVIDKLNAAADDRQIESKDGRPLEDVVEVTRKSFGLTETEGASIMKHLVAGGDLSRWGVVNAITRTAHNATTYDRFDDLQRIGGQIIELTRKSWAQIALLN